jgi:DNA-binding MurR/RpiR family transcriptional regulator
MRRAGPTSDAAVAGPVPGEEPDAGSTNGTHPPAPAIGAAKRSRGRGRRAVPGIAPMPARDARDSRGSPLSGFGPERHQPLSSYIQAHFDRCSRSQKDVAQYIVDHLDEAAFQTAEELARRANTSSSTVVRFSQALGFEGYPELQAAARDEYRRMHAQAGSGAANSPQLFSLDQSEFETALAADHVNVEETARKVSRDAVEALIDAIVEAEKVVVAGTDQMAFFASYLRHLLMLLDLRVDVVASPSQEALSRLGRIDEDTLVIGLSAGRPHPLIVRALKLARHRGGQTAAITDATLSEVAKLGEIKLYYSSNSPAYVRSHTALLSLIQALVYGVYARDSSQYEDRIKAFRLK